MTDADIWKLTPEIASVWYLKGREHMSLNRVDVTDVFMDKQGQPRVGFRDPLGHYVTLSMPAFLDKFERVMVIREDQP